MIVYNNMAQWMVTIAPCKLVATLLYEIEDSSISNGTKPSVTGSADTHTH